MISEKKKAVYSNGALILEKPLDVTEGTHVEIVVFDERTQKSSAASVAKRLAKIAKMPSQGKPNKFSSIDLDRIY